MWLKGAKKRLGGTVIYQAGGQTRQRELAAEISNPRTESQMGQRVKWANLVNLYRANRSWMKYAFETKKSNQSEYNKFMSLNVSNSRIYLTKPVANAGGCVVDTYIITQGSLPSIEFVPTTNGYFRSNIEIAPSTDFNTISVKEFSDTVVELNPAIRYGDQLSFIRMTQMTNASTGVPYVVVREYEVIIDANNLEPLSNYLPMEYLTVWGGEEKFLAVQTASGRSGGFAMILSRTISGKTYVSSQRIIPVAMDAYIEAFSNSAALQAAINSYGVSEDAFLSSTYAAQNSQAATTLALLSAQFEPDGIDVVAGSRFVISAIGTGDNIRLNFNSSLPAGTQVSGVSLRTNKGRFDVPEVEVRGNRVVGAVTGADDENVVVHAVVATVDSSEYRLEFLVYDSDYSGGGIE